MIRHLFLIVITALTFTFAQSARAEFQCSLTYESPDHFYAQATATSGADQILKVGSYRV